MPTQQTPLYTQAYEEYIDHAHDPVWRLAMEIYLGETFQEMAQYHQGQIQAIADKAALSHLSSLRAGITKRYLADRLEEIQKSTKKKHLGGMVHWSREGDWVRQQGRFARYVGPARNRAPHPRDIPGSENIEDPKAFLRQAMLHDIPKSDAALQRRVRGMRMSNAVELPVTSDFVQHESDVHARTAELFNDIFARTRDPRDKQRVQYVIQAPDGAKRIDTPKAGELPAVDYAHGERVHFMTPVGPDNPVHVGGQAVNIGLIAGMSPEQAAKVGGVTQGIHNTMAQTSWGQKMQAVAGAAAAISNNHPMFNQAHAFAQMVNLIGPEASRAFGGKLRQLTYRYTGQEIPREDYSEAAKAGKQGNESTEDVEHKLMVDLAKTGALPSTTEYATSMKAGSTPPSHGYILDKNGKVVSQAVGYADDWYTPFNLKKLPQMRGGSYVRTRSYGGITPEDIRLAMRTGAHRVTVMSNNGVFSMEFNPKALHWGHRYGFGGGAMVRRYAKSLDAIKNGEVSADVEGDDKLKLNARGYQAAMDDLRLKYPYWVKHPMTTKFEAFHRPLGGGEGTNGVGFHNPKEAQGDRLEEGNYVSPINSRASGAMHGWYEKDGEGQPAISSFSMWEHPETGKVAYNAIDRYQVHHDTLLNAHRLREKMEAPQAAQQTGGHTVRTAAVPTGPQPARRPAPPAQGQRQGLTQQQAAQVQGAGQRGTIEFDENNVDRDSTETYFHALRKFIHQANDPNRPGQVTDLKDEIDPDDALMNDIYDVALSEKPVDHPKYDKVIDALATSKKHRDHVTDVLTSAFGVAEGRTYSPADADRILIGLQDLPQVQVDQSQADTDAGAAAAAAAQSNLPVYDKTKILPRKVVELANKQDGNLINLWLTTRAGHQDKQDFEKLWKPTRQHADGPDKARKALSDVDRKRFDRINGILAEALNAENQRLAAPADEQDDGATLTNDQVSDVVSSQNEPVEAHVTKELEKLRGNKPLSDEDVSMKAMELSAKYRDEANARRRNNEVGEAWHRAVAKDIDQRISAAIQAAQRSSNEDATLNQMEADLDLANDPDAQNFHRDDQDY